MRSRNILGGFLIIVGIVFMLDSLNIISGEPDSWIGALFLIFLGFFLLGRRKTDISTESYSLELGSLKSAKVVFHHGAGRLRVGDGAPEGYLLAGTFRGGVERQVKTSDEHIDVDLKVSMQDFSKWFSPESWNSKQPGASWDIALSENVQLTLMFETGASESTIDLARLNVGELSLKTGASATAITMSATTDFTKAFISSGAAGVTIQIPSGVAARISGTMGLGALDVDQGRFPKQGDIYQSPDYDSAAKKTEIRIEGGVGAVRIY